MYNSFDSIRNCMDTQQAVLGILLMFFSSNDLCAKHQFPNNKTYTDTYHCTDVCIYNISFFTLVLIAYGRLLL